MSSPTTTKRPETRPKADRPDPRDRPDDFLHYVGKEDIAFSQEFGIGVPALCGIWMNATQAAGGAGTATICPRCQRLFGRLSGR